MRRETPRYRYAQILLVEDNFDDVVLTREAFEHAGVDASIHHVSNGEQCLAFLRKQGAYAEAPTPHLVLLDLNLPVMDGREALAQIVADPKLNHTPVVILTTSDSEHDVLKTYKLRCNAYIAKPVDFDEFIRVVRSLADYWFSVVALPRVR